MFAHKPQLIIASIIALFGATALMPAFPAFAAANNIEAVKNFVGDNDVITQAFLLEQKAGAEGAPKEQPWSGSYWPLHSGSIACPYHQGDRPWFNILTRKLKSVGSNDRQLMKRLAKIRDDIDRLSDERIGDLSPAEKYDLYLGDHDFTLTQSVLQSMREQHERIGKIALWEGSCHGWATASVHVPRPNVTIRMMSLDGKYLIPFYPDDLKALATLLWANSLVQDHTISQGLRCTKRNPDYDQSNGKVLNTSCQGVNPADFHISVLEMVGARKKSFIINRVNTTQVWNQPISNYKLEYFDPANGEEKKTMLDATIARDPSKDPFNPYRPAGSKFWVGIKMTLKYTSETNPSHDGVNQPKDDKIKAMHLFYDLVLNERYEIIGGEWRGSDDQEADEDGIDIPKFPGFIWTFKDQNPTAFSVADFDLPADTVEHLPIEQVLAASKKGAQFRYRVDKYNDAGQVVSTRMELRPQPLGKVVNALIKESHLISR